MKNLLNFITSSHKRVTQLKQLKTPPILSKIDIRDNFLSTKI